MYSPLKINWKERRKKADNLETRYETIATGFLLSESFSLDPIPRFLKKKENRFENDSTLSPQFFLFFSFFFLATIRTTNLSSRIRIEQEEGKRGSFSTRFSCLDLEICDFQDTLLSQHRFLFSQRVLSKLPPSPAKFLAISLFLFFFLFFFSRRRLRTRCFDRFSGNMYLG